MGTKELYAEKYRDFVIVKTVIPNIPWAVYTESGQFVAIFLSKSSAIAFIDLSYKEK